VVDERRDMATASLIENWIDETERRTCSCPAGVETRLPSARD
jgi:hypothetical protein